MKNRTDILNELLSIAPALASVDKVNLYEIDQSYFGKFQAGIIELIEQPAIRGEVVTPMLSFIEKKELYTAPSPLYFQSFSDGIMGQIHAEEVAEELSYALPLLAGMDKKAQHSPVPAMYFDSFPETITHMAAREAVEHTSVIEQVSSRWSMVLEAIRSLVARPRYSFAMASVVGVMMCIALVVNNKTLSAEDRIVAQMQQLPDADIHHYVASHRDDFDERTILHDINNVDFTHYFDRPEQVTPHIERHIQADNEEINEDILD